MPRPAATSSPCSPGPSATATRPSVAIRRSASSAPRSAMAPRRTSTVSGAGSRRARSGMGLLPYDERGSPGDRRWLATGDRADTGCFAVALPEIPPARLAVGGDLPGPTQVSVVVDLDPVDRVADRRRRDPAAPVGEFLIAVLVVPAGVAPPGGLQRVGERPGGRGLDEGGADVLAVRARRVHLLGDVLQQAALV